MKNTMPPSLYRAFNALEEHNHRIEGLVALLRTQLYDLASDQPNGLSMSEAVSVHTLFDDMAKRCVELQVAVFDAWDEHSQSEEGGQDQ